MANYLIICSDYLSSSDANGNCMRNIVTELVRRNNRVYVISEADTNGLILKSENTCVYGVKRPLFARFERKFGEYSGVTSAVRLLRACCVAMLYPNVSPLRSIRVLKFAEELISSLDIHSVLCAYRPFESLYAGVRLKKRFPSLQVVGYHLDLLKAANSKNAFVRDFKTRRGEAFFEKEKEIFSRIILPKSMKDKENYGGAVRFADFPLFVTDEHNVADINVYDKSNLNFAYIGSIDGSNREIGYLLQVLGGVEKKLKKKVVLHIWGSISSKIQMKIDASETASFHGVVDSSQATELLRSADFVVNLSNKNTPEMVPSKIFQLFSSGTPILNVVEKPEDAALVYFKINDYSCNILAYRKDLANDISKVLVFIETYYEKKQEMAVLEQMYKESSPEYVVDLIENN